MRAAKLRRGRLIVQIEAPKPFKMRFCGASSPGCLFHQNLVHLLGTVLVVAIEVDRSFWNRYVKAIQNGVYLMVDGNIPE